MRNQSTSTSHWILGDGTLEVSYTADAGVQVTTTLGSKLPWRIDIDEGSTWAQVKVGSEVARHPVKLAALKEQRLSPTRIQWIGEIAGAGVALEIELADAALMFSVAHDGVNSREGFR